MVPALADLLKDPDETVRRQAVRAMMQIHPGPQVMVPLCDPASGGFGPGRAVRILNAISEAGPKAVPGLIEALKNDKAAYWACLVLRDMGPAAKDAVPALTEKLHDPRPKFAARRFSPWRRWTARPPRPSRRLPRPWATSTPASRPPMPGRIGQIPADAEAVIRATSTATTRCWSITSLWALARVHPEDKQIRRGPPSD